VRGRDAIVALDAGRGAITRRVAVGAAPVTLLAAGDRLWAEAHAPRPVTGAGRSS
jgi:hypothetical protein